MKFKLSNEKSSLYKLVICYYLYSYIIISLILLFLFRIFNYFSGDKILATEDIRNMYNDTQ